MNIKKQFTLAGILFMALTLLLAGTMACAQPRQKKGGPSTNDFFQRFDTDNDAKLTLEEFPGPDEHFSQFDKNSDGFIEKDEMKTVPPPPRD